MRGVRVYYEEQKKKVVSGWGNAVCVCVGFLLLLLTRLVGRAAPAHKPAAREREVAAQREERRARKNRIERKWSMCPGVCVLSLSERAVFTDCGAKSTAQHKTAAAADATKLALYYYKRWMNKKK